MSFELQMHHVHLCCGDVEGAAAWFVEMLGARNEGTVRFYGGASGVKLVLGGANFYVRGPRPDEELGPGTAPDRYGFDHIGFRVDNMMEIERHLRARGVDFEVPVHEHRPGNLVAFIRGPESLRIELSEVKEPRLQPRST